jgi:hypothetical protein
MAFTACLVWLIGTVNGCNKKEKEGEALDDWH